MDKRLYCLTFSKRNQLAQTMESSDWFLIQEAPLVNNNNSHKTLDDFNDEESLRRLVPLVFLGVNMIVGVIGNSIVLIVYPTSKSAIVKTQMMYTLQSLTVICFFIGLQILLYFSYDIPMKTNKYAHTAFPIIAESTLLVVSVILIGIIILLYSDRKDYFNSISFQDTVSKLFYKLCNNF
jgi:hypothetical protein